MKIKGKVFVHRVISLSLVGEKGFVSIDTCRIFQNQMYINIRNPYTLKKTQDRVIPFERVSEDENGFEFDFSELSIIYPEEIDIPNIDEGWIGPFDVDHEIFSYEKFYEKTSFLDLRALWLAAYSDYDFYMTDIFLNLKSLSLKKMIDNSFNEINETIENLKEYNDGLKKSKIDTDPNEIDEEWYTKVEQENISDLFGLEEILSVKLTQDIDQFGKEDLEYLIENLDLTKQDANFSRAAKIKQRIDLLTKQEKIEIQSN